jgi:hypothetical protein
VFKDFSCSRCIRARVSCRGCCSSRNADITGAAAFPGSRRPWETSSLSTIGSVCLTTWPRLLSWADCIHQEVLGRIGQQPGAFAWASSVERRISESFCVIRPGSCLAPACHAKRQKVKVPYLLYVARRKGRVPQAKLKTTSTFKENKVTYLKVRYNTLANLPTVEILRWGSDQMLLRYRTLGGTLVFSVERGNRDKVQGIIWVPGIIDTVKSSPVNSQVAL